MAGLADDIYGAEYEREPLVKIADFEEANVLY